MKRIILLSIVAVCFYSCDSMLDIYPEDSVSKEVFFSDQNDFDLALTGLYSGLRAKGANADNGAYGGLLYWDVCADAMFFQFSWHTPWYDISAGNLNPNTSGIANIWSLLYSSINWANTIIEQVDNNGNMLDASFARSVKGEAHFVRAICYIRLTSLFGAVPMVDRLLTPTEAKLPRTSVNDVTNQLIIPDLNIAIDNLEEYPYGGKYGKATKLSAMGMKVRAYLYNKDYANTVAAAQELMALENTSQYLSFLDNYKSIFANDNENNPEILFCIKYAAGGQKEGSTFNTPFGSYIPGLSQGSMNGSWNSSIITPEYIDSYYYIDGQYAETSRWYNPENPWSNRGPRFESTFYIGDYTVLPNGLLFEKSMVCVFNNDYIEKYPFNLNKGYMNEDSKIDWTDEDESDFIIIRYTDVLMMYAEAKTELNQIDETVYEILDRVRERAGIDPVTRGQSQDQMRKTIQLERKLEFAFEGLRYFDIRRWGIADEVINSIKSDDAAEGGYNFGSTKKFNPANYLWPIPQSAIDVNPNLLPNNQGY